MQLSGDHDMAKRKGLNETVPSNDDWQAEDDLRTLMRAEEIKADPKRCDRARALAKKRMTEVAKVATTE
jgi:hypothetical protein